MNFFKKLFSSNKNTNEPGREPSAGFSGVGTQAGFAKRYVEEKINPELMSGCLKVLMSYFLDNKIEPKVKETVNHPRNLDQTMEEGLDFDFY